MRQDLLSIDDSVLIYDRANAILEGNEYDVSASAVLKLAKSSGCSAYDCEFIALAQYLEVQFISADSKLCKAFPNCATLLTNA